MLLKNTCVALGAGALLIGEAVADAYLERFAQLSRSKGRTDTRFQKSREETKATNTSSFRYLTNTTERKFNAMMGGSFDLKTSQHIE